MISKKLEDILLKSGAVTREQLDTALSIQQESNKSLGAILIEEKFISKEDLARAYAAQLGIPYIEKITESMADPNLLRLAPLRFLREHVVLPIVFDSEKTILTSNPYNLTPLDELGLLLRGNPGYAISTSDVIIEAINKYYPFETGPVMEELAGEGEEHIDLGMIQEKDILEMANDAPIIKLVNQILFQAAKEEASDIHIEPFEKELRVRYRIYGTLFQKFLPPKRYQGAIVSRIKIMANLNIAEKRLPQDGRIQVKIANRPIDIRVSILPSQFGERVVMRLLDKSKGTFDLAKLGLAKKDFDLLSAQIDRPEGIILVTGPTGSGKTTTLYGILTKLNSPEVNIITVEDPVEYTINGVNQVQVREKVGLTFAAALRSILRQDPDIVLIGEIRDTETAQIATQAALTGHLVLSTLHTNSAPATITRLLDMGIEPFLIADTLILIMAQRLVRKLCNHCKKISHPSAEVLERVGITPQQAKKMTIYEPVGCDECFGGYVGRIGIFELMDINDEIRELIVQRANASVIRRKALQLGMTMLATDGIRRIQEGVTTIEEVLRVAHAEEGMDEVAAEL